MCNEPPVLDQHAKEKARASIRCKRIRTNLEGGGWHVLAADYMQEAGLGSNASP